jgi:hypothetical protein
MASNLGGKREGAGRPKGSRNKYNCEMEGLLKARMAELGHFDYDPVVCMAEIALDASNPIELRFKAHSEVAQYVRAKKRTNDFGPGEKQIAYNRNHPAPTRFVTVAHELAHLFYARAYGLTRDELRYILDPADVRGPDYPSETFRVLKEKEIRQHGEYRTRRLVLAAWDRMEANGEFTAMGM